LNPYVGQGFVTKCESYPHSCVATLSRTIAETVTGMLV
jgi:hypothetical protein